MYFVQCSTRLINIYLLVYWLLPTIEIIAFLAYFVYLEKMYFYNSIYLKEYRGLANKIGFQNKMNSLCALDH